MKHKLNYEFLCCHCGKEIQSPDPFYRRGYYKGCSMECLEIFETYIDNDIHQAKLKIPDYREHETYCSGNW